MFSTKPSAAELLDSILPCLSFPTRTIITIAGIPGSGKSTIVSSLQSEAALRKLEHKIAIISMDGWHYPRQVLEQMSNPEEAFRRRGAPFTFDAEGCIDMFSRIKQGEDVTCPTFDHQEKDPVFNAVKITSERIVIVEGLYLSYTEPPWDRIIPSVDKAWFLECDFNTAANRVVSRHVESGISRDIESAWKRWHGNDKINAELIVKHKGQIDLYIQSL